MQETLTVYALSIDGVPLPRPMQNGVTITDEKIWTAATGRAESAKMLGNIKAVKVTIAISWPSLTGAEAALIRRMVSDKDHPFRVLRYVDVDGTATEKTVYFGNPSFPVRTIRHGVRVSGLTVNCIEQ